MERLSRKASSDNFKAARTKTDTGGRAEDAKVSERTVAKELVKMAQYVRKKGRSKEPQLKCPSDCLTKTQLYAKPQGEVYGVTPAR